MQQLKHLLSALLLITTLCAQAQVGIGTATPAASAQLDVSSTTKGFLPPRMTTAQRDLIGTPAAGLIIYNTTISGLQIYSGSIWYTASAATTMGAIGASATTNGGTITAGVLSLAPADGGNGGIVTNGTQTFGGDKTFTQSVTANSFVKTGGVSSQYLMADGSTSPRIALGPVGGTSTSNGATLTNGTLSLAPADATNSGIVTTGAQTFAGNKTFSSAIKITAGTPGAGKVLTSDAAGLASWESASPCGYAIGQNVTALGGIIFYLDASGCHGLVCAPTDQSTGIRWYNGIYTNTTAFADCVGGGAGNTSMIIYNQGATATSYAAGLARAYTAGGVFSDYFLPSKYELNLMYKNIGLGNALGLGNVGGFASYYYWSSTETDNFSAWKQSFNYGLQSSYLKDSTSYVRAVRAF